MWLITETKKNKTIFFAENKIMFSENKHFLRKINSSIQLLDLMLCH